MNWPVIMHVCEAAYPLGVVQRAAYSLADTLTIEVSVETGQVKLSIFPSQDQLTLPSARAAAEKEPRSTTARNNWTLSLVKLIAPPIN